MFYIWLWLFFYGAQYFAWRLVDSLLSFPQSPTPYPQADDGKTQSDMLLILFDEVKDDEDLRNVGVANIAKELKDAAEKLLDYKNKVSDWPHETEDCEKTMKRRDEVVKHISEFERCRAHVNDYVAALSRTQKERK